MTIWNLIRREIWHSKLGSLSTLASVLVAIASIVGAFTLLQAHDVRTDRILDKKQQATREDMEELRQEMRRATLQLGFNVVILPKGQELTEWYNRGYASETMPENWAQKLAESRTLTSIRHILPVLQKKIQWEDMSREVMIRAHRGELPLKHRPEKPDLVQSVPRGKILIGHALHEELDLSRGDNVRIRGREFTVEAYRPAQGSQDDITIWMHLEDAQELWDQQDRINAIIALQCMCTGIHFKEKVKSQIKEILPDAQVIIREAKASARARARLSTREKAEKALKREQRNRRKLREEREGLAAVLVPLVLAASAIWIGLTAMVNVRERRGEIAILRAVGLRSWHVMSLFLIKAAAIGLIGGALGYGVGFLGGRYMEAWLSTSAAHPLGIGVLFRPAVLFLGLVLAPCLAALAAWIPALVAAYHDPADILSEE